MLPELSYLLNIYYLHSTDRPEARAAPSGATDDVPLIDLAAETDSTSLRSEESSSNVLITMTTGAKAQWRRNKNKNGGGSIETDESSSGDGSQRESSSSSSGCGSQNESSSSSNCGSHPESSIGNPRRTGDSDVILREPSVDPSFESATTSIQLQRLNNNKSHCDIEQTSSTVPPTSTSSQRDTSLHNINTKPDERKPEPVLNQPVDMDGEKKQEQDFEGVQLQMINTLKDVDSHSEDGLEDIVDDKLHSIIAQRGRNRLRSSFTDHPADGASASDVSITDWPEGDGDASLLSLE